MMGVTVDIAIVLSFFVGAFAQRLLIYFAVGTVRPTVCDYCQWMRNRECGDSKRGRHKK